MLNFLDAIDYLEKNTTQFEPQKEEPKPTPPKAEPIPPKEEPTPPQEGTEGEELL